MASEDQGFGPELVCRCIKIFRIEAHSRRKIVKILGNVSIIVMSTETGEIEQQYTSEFKKIVHLLGLSRSSNSEKLAHEIFEGCKFLDEGKFGELVDALNEAKSREYDISGTVVHKPFAADGSYLPRFQEFFDEDFDNCEGEGVAPQLDEINHYVELLYEDLLQKIEGTCALASLASCPANIPEIVKHDAAISALFRTLREDYRKSIILTKQILSICSTLAKYVEFHELFIRNKMHGTILEIIDFNIETLERWKAEIIELEVHEYDQDCLWTRLEKLASTQNSCIRAGLEVLQYLSKHWVVREKLLEERITSMLCITLDRKDNELFDVVVAFLRNLSCYHPFVDQMKCVGLVAKIVSILKDGTPIPKRAVASSLTLLYNLCFHNDLREEVLQAGLLSVLANCLRRPKLTEISSKLLYLLTLTDEGRKSAVKPFLINEILNTDLSDSQFDSEALAALLVNLSSLSRGSKMIWASDKIGMLIKFALSREKFLLLKMFRNIAEQDAKPMLYENLGSIAMTMINSTNPMLVEECLGMLAALSSEKVQFKIIALNGQLFPWLKETLNFYGGIMQNRTPELNFDLSRVSVDAVRLMKIISFSVEGARVIVGEGFIEILLRILCSASTTEDSPTQLNTLDLLKCLAGHEPIAVYLAQKTLIPSKILEMATDEGRSTDFQNRACLILEQISKYDDTWKDNVQKHHFLSWNKAWVAAMQVQ